MAALAGLTLLGFVVAQPAFSFDDANKRRITSLEQLDQVRRDIALSEQQRQSLAQEIDALEKDRANINRELIETANRSRQLEARVGRTGLRLLELAGEEEEVRQSLAGRTELLSQVLGALQRLSRSPPPALLVTPEDALASVRSAILLGSVVPEVRAETVVLQTELAELTRIRTDIAAQQASLHQDLTSLVEEEERLTLLTNQKRDLANRARNELAEQSSQAAALSARATNLEELIASLEVEIAAVEEAAQAARQADAARREREAAQIEIAREEVSKPDFSDTGRIAPAVGFDQARGVLPIPVRGVVVARFGDIDTLGSAANGLSVATRVNATVISPADGWVVYSGPFRSYGQLLILNAGDGYHIVLSGMETINVDLGQFVLAGEPVGSMGARRIASSGAVDIGSARPVLYVEFRKDGEPIDPAPWWADTNS